MAVDAFKWCRSLELPNVCVQLRVDEIERAKRAHNSPLVSCNTGLDGNSARSCILYSQGLLVRTYRHGYWSFGANVSGIDSVATCVSIAGWNSNCACNRSCARSSVTGK